MNPKPWYRRKTLWVGVVAIAAGLIQGIFDGNWSDGLTKILGGLAAITGRQTLAALGR